ncbi:addiction module antidote protein [Klebsiella pneumoniae subsp. pneumoniae]|uniref:addiction module antidote protein n=1 Tax=Klebsiella pneumoniae TaxID=573 RepID=UPI000813BE11|nr:addiction module antidote protein [Klebsiella pneumoniae]MCS5780580.1 addiction module antidote protein [Klebsiella pneumoniae subsp. pneumoniae]MCS5844690.1 addiction module antidote protein [Klebsiella pneumoniae subsp. pneumoniae]MDF9974029.1 addiction module antidote protein [Klebsiella pneumoniae]MDS0471215.1 addiction module antidote protein [Klebsiella pneumoniae]TXW46787.1 addiction module antidote protein [Klebsiella pneumoniae]
MKDRSHDTAMAECFRADPPYAAELLTEVRREGNPAELAILLRQMATASVDVAGLDGAETGWATRVDFRKL